MIVSPLLQLIVLFILLSCLHIFSFFASTQIDCCHFPLALAPFFLNQVRMHACFPLVVVDCFSHTSFTLVQLFFLLCLQSASLAMGLQNQGEDRWLFLPCHGWLLFFMLVHCFSLACLQAVLCSTNCRSYLQQSRWRCMIVPPCCLLLIFIPTSFMLAMADCWKKTLLLKCYHAKP